MVPWFNARKAPSLAAGFRLSADSADNLFDLSCISNAFRTSITGESGQRRRPPNQNGTAPVMSLDECTSTDIAVGEIEPERTSGQMSSLARIFKRPFPTRTSSICDTL
jgi:hypothetical protein